MEFFDVFATSNNHVFCFLRVDGHEVISSPIEHLVSRKLECRKNIGITCIRHMNTSVNCKHITSSTRRSQVEIEVVLKHNLVRNCMVNLAFDRCLMGINLRLMCIDLYEKLMCMLVFSVARGRR